MTPLVVDWLRYRRTIVYELVSYLFDYLGKTVADFFHFAQQTVLKIVLVIPNDNNSDCSRCSERSLEDRSTPL